MDRAFTFILKESKELCSLGSGLTNIWAYRLEVLKNSELVDRISESPVTNPEFAFPSERKIRHANMSFYNVVANILVDTNTTAESLEDSESAKAFVEFLANDKAWAAYKEGDLKKQNELNNSPLYRKEDEDDEIDEADRDDFNTFTITTEDNTNNQDDEQDDLDRDDDVPIDFTGDQGRDDAYDAFINANDADTDSDDEE
jgi:hypothetical protein